MGSFKWGDKSTNMVCSSLSFYIYLYTCVCLVCRRIYIYRERMRECTHIYEYVHEGSYYRALDSVF